MIALAGSVLAASLLGSPHCAGMCGGFVCFYAGQGGGRRTLAHLAYHLGRLTSYLALGAVAGVVGERVERLGLVVGVSRGAAVVAGALMIVWGGAALAHALGARLPLPGAPRAAHAPLAAALRRLHDRPAPVRALAIGLLTTLLPCGWLYGFAATASGTGSVPAAMVVMGAFWAGTLPVMAGLGVAAQHAFGPLRRRLPAITAGLLVVLGLLTLAGKFGPGTMPMHAHPAVTSHVDG